MTSVELVSIDHRQAALTGFDLPDPPPTRIYISGRYYTLGAPRGILPALASTIKVILNWASTAGRIAKNIGYVLTGSGVDTTDSTFLLNVANQVMTSWGSAGIVPQYSSQWTLNSVTAKDNSGNSSAQAISTHSPYTGSNASNALPPQTAVVFSWSIAASYRGGKPRWYMPGVPTNALNVVSDSALSSSYATALEVAVNSFAASFNSSSPSTHAVTLGTISHYSGHAIRPVPLFRPFGLCHVHERLDSQRRRSGKESLFPVVP